MFFVAPATQAKVCFNEVKKVLLWVVEMYLNFRRHDEEVWIDEPDAHLYSWLYGWIFATTLKLKKSYVNSSIFKISGLLKWSRVLRSSPFRILNSLEQEFWCHPRRIHKHWPASCFNDEKHARANVPQILVEIRTNCLFDGNLFYYIQKRGSWGGQYGKSFRDCLLRLSPKHFGPEKEVCNVVNWRHTKGLQMFILRERIRQQKEF